MLAQRRFAGYQAAHLLWLALACFGLLWLALACLFLLWCVPFLEWFISACNISFLLFFAFCFNLVFAIFCFLLFFAVGGGV